ncbi:Eukaryotic aspartyl protease family protein [Euphorbia peplus]|nr:Eukaryotic aspartyl protease family protein [Euphorbia peplus]
MASSSSSLLLPLFFFFIIYPIQAQLQTPILPNSAIFPITKDLKTLQYITQTHHVHRKKPINLVLDLSSPFLWISSDSEELISIPSCSIQCSMAKPFHFGDKKHCFFNTHLSKCHLSVQNGITGMTKKGELVEDLIVVRSESGNGFTEGLLFARGSKALLNGLASEAQGVMGLGRSPIGIPSQLAAKFEFDMRFVTCLGSSNGFLSFGKMGMNSILGLTSLTYTNLVNYQDVSVNSQDYYINVRGIKVNGKRVALGLGQEGLGRTKISTIVPYTTLESSIYGIFKSAYLKAAKYMNMIRVNSPKGPFDLCFSSKGSGKDTSVPEIDLVLQSEMVKWRINGRNSMVKMSDEVVCLGILDGGFDSKTSIVIGGFQLEDMLLEFDLGTNMLGFSQASCADYIVESGVKESL